MGQKTISSTRHPREVAMRPEIGVSEGYLRPQLRVGRMADYQNGYEWDLALNEIHSRNRRRGNALPLAGIACHYVLDREIRAMLEAKCSDVHGSRHGAQIALREYAGLSKRLGKYMNVIQGAAMVVLKQGYLGEHPELMGKTHAVRRQPNPHEAIWQEATLNLRPVGSGGTISYGNKLGFDLSQNPILYEERREVVNYLRSDEGMDIRLLPRDWRPHATFFIAHSHLRADFGPMKYPVDMPHEMDFLAPQVDYEHSLASS